MLELLKWTDRRPGDVGLVNNPSNALSNAIVDCERELNPLSDTHIFIPSHAFIVAEPGWVCEAWLDLHTDSAVAMNPDSKYTGYLEAGQMQLWRCEASATICQDALNSLREALSGDRYSVENLLGFGWEALVKFVFDKTIDNPLDVSVVCSQLALGFVIVVNAYSGAEPWVKAVSIRDCTPDVLGIAFAANQTQP